MANETSLSTDLIKLKSRIQDWAKDLGFSGFGVADTDISTAEKYLFSWLGKKQHGEMTFMEKHGTRRSKPEALIPNTVRILSFRMNYWQEHTTSPEQILGNRDLAYISRYALGKDYHKLMRRRLKKISDKISEQIPGYQFRPFVDSAPVMEKPLAVKAGLGWMGKNTNLIDKNSGSWFFLGELYTNLPLPIDQPQRDLCGSCTQCMTICPTNAIVAPYQLDATLCISYLTIEHKTSIPVHLRNSIGNRIFGCDDCQIVCPWNQYAINTEVHEFSPQHKLDNIDLITLFYWTEDEYKLNTAGSPLKRVGYECWLRNIAVALGNSSRSERVITALRSRLNHPSLLVREHVLWALEQHNLPSSNIN